MLRHHCASTREMGVMYHNAYVGPRAGLGFVRINLIGGLLSAKKPAH